MNHCDYNGGTRGGNFNSFGNQQVSIRHYVYLVLATLHHS